LGGQKPSFGKNLQQVVVRFEITFEELGEMFEGYSADTGAGKFPLVPIGD
jgi:hypothetical protein